MADKQFVQRWSWTATGMRSVGPDDDPPTSYVYAHDYDALRAQPSAGHVAPTELDRAAVARGIGTEPTNDEPAPPRDAGLVAELNYCIANPDAITHIPREHRLDILRALRDRLAAMDGDARSQAQDIARQNQRIAALQSELAQATARAEQMQSAMRDHIAILGHARHQFAAQDRQTLDHWATALCAAIASGTGADQRPFKECYGCSSPNECRRDGCVRVRLASGTGAK